MAQQLKTPEFKSEAEEARWWDNNPDLLLKEFETAAKDGTLSRGTLVRRGQTPTTTIRLDPVDIELAKSQAEKRGIKYQTYLKMIIHQALRQDDHPKKVTKAVIRRRATVPHERRKNV
jgi:predicted DNA binding CopG/RHH family protein